MSSWDHIVIKYMPPFFILDLISCEYEKFGRIPISHMTNVWIGSVMAPKVEMTHRVASWASTPSTYNRALGLKKYQNLILVNTTQMNLNYLIFCDRSRNSLKMNLCEEEVVIAGHDENESRIHQKFTSWKLPIFQMNPYTSHVSGPWWNVYKWI